MGRVSFPAMGKKPKDRRGRLTSPSGTGSLRLQFVLPQAPGDYGDPMLDTRASLSGAGETTTAPASAPLPLSVRNQDGLVCWTKQARLIAQVLISAAVNWWAGQEPRPYKAISVGTVSLPRLVPTSRGRGCKSGARRFVHNGRRRRPPTQSPAKRVCVGEAERWNERTLPFQAKRGI